MRDREINEFNSSHPLTFSRRLTHYCVIGFLACYARDCLTEETCLQDSEANASELLETLEDMFLRY